MGGRAGKVVMIGAALVLGGGINAVVQTYREQGLFARRDVAYLSSYLGKGPLRQARTVARAMFQMVWLLLKSDVALVHVHSAARGSFWRKSAFCALARAAGVPYVFHVHSGEFTQFYSQELRGPGRWWLRAVLRHATAVAVLTPTWLAPMSAIEPRGRYRVLLNPVALPPAIPPRTINARRVLFLGRLRASKGIFDLIQAMPAVHAVHPDVQFCLAGDGELDEVRAAVERFGVSHLVQLPGWIDGQRKYDELARADLLALPSHAEGLPICVLEAMAFGIPVVATSVGGTAFALDNGRCGALVPVAEPAVLAAAIIRLLSDTAEHTRLAAVARKRAEELFSPERVCAAVEALWGECIGAGAAVPASAD